MSKPVGCLLWLVVLLVILVMAAVLFGGFQTGTKVNGSPRGPGLPAAASAQSGHVALATDVSAPNAEHDSDTLSYQLSGAEGQALNW